MPDRGVKKIGLIQKTKAAIEALLIGEITTHTHPGNNITKEGVEAVLTGDISSHTHSIYLTQQQVEGLR